LYIQFARKASDAKYNICTQGRDDMNMLIMMLQQTSLQQKGAKEGTRVARIGDYQGESLLIRFSKTRDAEGVERRWEGRARAEIVWGSIGLPCPYSLLNKSGCS